MRSAVRSPTPLRRWCRRCPQNRPARRALRPRRQRPSFSSAPTWTRSASPSRSCHADVMACSPVRVRGPAQVVFTRATGKHKESEAADVQLGRQVYPEEAARMFRKGDDGACVPYAPNGFKLTQPDATDSWYAATPAASSRVNCRAASVAAVERFQTDAPTTRVAACSLCSPIHRARRPPARLSPRRRAHLRNRPPSQPSRRRIRATRHSSSMREAPGNASRSVRSPHSV